MKEIFAALYENGFGIYSEDHFLIFDNLFDNGGYIKLGFTFILIPLFCWFLFYSLWRYPYGKYWHWLIWLLIVTVIVIGVTIGFARTEIFASPDPELINALGDPGSGYETYASSLPGKYALVNGILTLIISCIYSLILKQFSKIQAHLPV
jgi:hypothetical protein